MCIDVLEQKLGMVACVWYFVHADTFSSFCFSGVIYGASWVGALARVLLHGIDYVRRNEQSLLLTDHRNPFCESVSVLLLFPLMFFSLFTRTHPSVTVMIGMWIREFVHSFIFSEHIIMVSVMAQPKSGIPEHCARGRITPWMGRQTIAGHCAHIHS